MTNRKLLASALTLPVCAISLIASQSAAAASGSWNVDANGLWDDAANWDLITIADGADNTATFGFDLTADRTVTLLTNRTIGNIDFDETNANLTIAATAAEVLTLANSTGTPTISVDNSSRDLFITATIAGTDGLSKTGAGDLFLTGANTFTGGIDLSAGRIVLANNGNEATNLGNAGNTLTFSGNADLHNNNGTVTFSQNIQINTGVTARITGAFGERFQVNGALSGDGTLIAQGFSAGYDLELLSTANTFTGNIEVQSGDSATLGVRSLADSVATIGLDSQANNGGTFELMSGAIAAMTFDNRQFELLVNGNSGSNIGRQARITNNSDQAFTINTDLLISGTGNKKLVLDGGTAGTNAFNGAIIDAIDDDVLTLYKRGNSTWDLGGINTYEGDTIVEDGTLTLLDNAELRIVIGDVGVNNAILGDASNDTLNLNGDLRFDLTAASTIEDDSWLIVDVDNLTETFGSTFGVQSTLGSFSESGDVWTISENGTSYVFEEATGVLTVVPEPGSLALLGLGGLLIAGRRRRG